MAHSAFKEIALSTDNKTLSDLLQALKAEQPDTLLLVLSDTNRVLRSAKSTSVPSDLPAGRVLFGAAPYFSFHIEQLRYFYWKHYPRPHAYYNFLDATAFLGHTKDITQLLEHAAQCYPDSSHYRLNDLLHRYYVDSRQGAFQPTVEPVLDHEQQILASTPLSARKTLHTNWRHQFLYSRNEKQLYTEAGKGAALRYPLNIREEDGQFNQLLTGTHPLLVMLDVPLPPQPEKPVPALNLKARFKTTEQVFKINRINKWHQRAEEIFRDTRNKSQSLTDATERIVSRLEQKEPLSFAHYNDGELTFIKDYQAGNHHNKWFGRKQQQYDPQLAERLQEAMQFQKEGYFVGVPCPVDHPKLSQLAHDIVGDHAFKVPAMAIHHNLSYLPRLLHALKGRNCYFFTNEYQDLSFFTHFGINVKEEQVVTVPFRNSYKEFDRYKDRRFPDDAVVVMTCGMLAKILVLPWYQNHERLTILALGSSLDDQLQPDNSNFELYPPDFPLTRNLHKSRAFLFGYKKRCKACYDY